MFHVKSALIVWCQKYSDRLDLLHLKDNENDHYALRTLTWCYIVLQKVMGKDTFAIVFYTILVMKGFYISSDKFV